MAARIRGRFADFEADPAITLPHVFTAHLPLLTDGTTNTIHYYMPGPGKVRTFAARVQRAGGTVTIDLLKNGVSMLASTRALPDDAMYVIEGVGGDSTGNDIDFDTDTAAHRLELDVAKGDVITVSIVPATANSTDYTHTLTCDLVQPTTKFDRA